MTLYSPFREMNLQGKLAALRYKEVSGRYTAYLCFVGAEVTGAVNL
jgi:hypothetical protein